MNIGSNKMYDEDFLEPYGPDSKTRSSTKNGRDVYGTLDLGHSLVQEKDWSLGGFVGYGYYRQHLNGYGCEQVAAGDFCAQASLIPASSLILSETEKWNALRLGLAGSALLSDRLTLSGEAVWLAYATLSAKDNHWYRPAINPIPEKGHGSQGYQLESTLSYAIDRQWNIGAGVRYLFLAAEGSMQFPGGIPSSQGKFESSRLTAFLQASYRFGEGAAY